MTWIDLTMPLSEKTPVFPGDPPARFEHVDGIPGAVCNQKQLAFNSHFGTHLDAPFHMLQDGKTLSDYAADRFVGKAVVFDVRGQMVIQLGEAQLNQIQRGDFVFFFTGHSDKAFQPGYFENNPVIPMETAEALVQRGISLVGLDSFTPDNAPYDVHKLFFKHDVLILENLVQLDRLFSSSATHFEVVAAPLKIDDGDGAPCRVLARPA